MRQLQGIWASIGLCTLAVTIVAPLRCPAAEEAPPDSAQALESEAPIPAAEDIRRMIKELASVRDYERLRWILDAVEAQVTPLRAELLKTLDDQVQQLLKAEVELRTAALLQVVPAAELGVSKPVPVAGAPKPLATRQTSGRRPDSITTLKVEEVEKEIEGTDLLLDGEKRRAQVLELQEKITQVDDPARRLDLVKRLQARNQEVFLTEMKARKAAWEAQSPAQRTVPAESSSADPDP